MVEDETSTESPQTTEIAKTTMQEIAVTTLLQIMRGVKSKMYCLATCQQMVSCVSVMFDRKSMICYLYDGINLNAAVNLYISTRENFENNNVKIGLWDRTK